MAAYKGWKELERRHAKRMKGKRLWRPDFGESMPDGENERETWDAKYSVRPVKLLSLFVECETKYREFTGSRNFHMVFYGSLTSKLGDIVACRASRYAELLEKEALLDSHVAALMSSITHRDGCQAGNDWPCNCP